MDGPTDEENVGSSTTHFRRLGVVSLYRIKPNKTSKDQYKIEQVKPLILLFISLSLYLWEVYWFSPANNLLEGRSYDFLKKILTKDMFIDFREKKKEGEGGRERNINLALTCNLGRCLDWESNQQPSGAWDDAPTK